MSTAIGAAAAQYMPAAATTPSPSEPVQPSERIDALDILRGIALLGMFIVHFNDNALAPTNAAGNVWARTVVLFFDERFWTMFGILFGAGFAVQLRRSQARGDDKRFWVRYLRRAFALGVFGFIAHGIFGYNVLMAYAIWGVGLLFVHTWSTRSLLILLVVCLSSRIIYIEAYGNYLNVTRGPGAFKKFNDAQQAERKALNDARKAADSTGKFVPIVRERLRGLPFFYSQPHSFMPFNNFALMLIGFLALRLGLFERPREHRRLIAWLMVFGVVSWAVNEWLLPIKLAQPAQPLPFWLGALRNQATFAFFLIREMWLAFAYMGAVLLALDAWPAVKRWLAPLGWTGRMALTNYMVQVMLLDFLFGKYLFDAKIPTLIAPLAALALFAIDALVSRWWLARFKYGPLEWAWRSFTYWRAEGIKVAAA